MLNGINCNAKCSRFYASMSYTLRPLLMNIYNIHIYVCCGNSAAMAFDVNTPFKSAESV
jgi:hypothetical protein